MAIENAYTQNNTQLVRKQAYTYNKDGSLKKVEQEDFLHPSSSVYDFFFTKNKNIYWCFINQGKKLKNIVPFDNTWSFLTNAYWIPDSVHVYKNKVRQPNIVIDFLGKSNSITDTLRFLGMERHRGFQNGEMIYTLDSVFNKGIGPSISVLMPNDTFATQFDCETGGRIFCYHTDYTKYFDMDSIRSLIFYVEKEIEIEKGAVWECPSEQKYNLKFSEPVLSKITLSKDEKGVFDQVTGYQVHYLYNKQKKLYIIEVHVDANGPKEQIRYYGKNYNDMDSIGSPVCPIIYREELVYDIFNRLSIRKIYNIQKNTKRKVKYYYDFRNRLLKDEEYIVN